MSAEPMLSVRQALAHLPAVTPTDALLRKLGHDATLASKAQRAPTGSTPVAGKPWPAEKTYTFAVLREVFRLNPDTAPHVPKEQEP